MVRRAWPNCSCNGVTCNCTDPGSGGWRQPLSATYRDCKASTAAYHEEGFGLAMRSGHEKPYSKRPALMAYRLPFQGWQLVKYLARAGYPLLLERLEIDVPDVEAASHRHPQAVALVAQQVDRHADREIAEHG